MKAAGTPESPLANQATLFRGLTDHQACSPTVAATHRGRFPKVRADAQVRSARVLPGRDLPRAAGPATEAGIWPARTS